MAQSEGIRGIGSSNRAAGYEADTARGEQGAIADMVNNRQQNYTAAIQGSLGIAGAAGDRALSEKRFGLDAQNSANQFGLASRAAESQAANDNFARYMALLNAQRNSPIYTGTTAAN